MASSYTGIYVVKSAGKVSEVQVVDADGDASSLTAETYEAEGYQPSIAELPEKGDYFDKLDLERGQDD
ncbi:hypothetical protein [Salinicola halophilus]|uniref:hypothetical protein n=1 Tax=Salinicola halophilus TaxID=184065 RepID=UPI000DA1387E|nr:hypothetical protein [Salinicola halophilus]